jgi:acyl-CoA oxidase
MPLPGVIVGDIGPKFGYLGNDNGFLILKNVRIPRDNMLMRYAKVDRQGNYSTPPHSKLAYATMVLMRTSIVVDSSIQLAKACTIAIRYSAVRRQFFSDSNPDQTSETKIIDYQTQQQKLFPLLAQAYMIHFTGIQMQTLYDKNVELVSKGNLSLMAEVHATSSCLKALFTALSCEGMENARKALGGHGYSRFSGSKFFFLCSIF